MKSKIKVVLLVSGVLFGQLIVGVLLSTGVLISFYNDRIVANTYINEVEVGGLKPERALTLLKQKFPQATKDSYLLLLDEKGESWKINCGEINLTYDYEGAVKQAFEIGKRP